MKVFVTGGSGWVGSAVVPELVAAGHLVTGLARSRASAEVLRGLGATAVAGDMEDLELIAGRATEADGVIHLAFRHDFADFARAVELDARVVGAIGDALAGSGKPFVITGGTPAIPGVLADETSKASPGSPSAGREGVSDLALSYADRAVRASVIRLPRSVHGKGDHGFIARLAATAREQGVSGYVGDGAQRWPAVHVNDAAHLYRLVLEKASAGSVLHAVGDEGIAFREIAAAVGRSTGLPSGSVEPQALGFLGILAGIDQPATATRTRALLGWNPERPGLIADIDAGYYR
ncbi:MAG: SDR family oxidoreductase [Bifidobacteriaceae bacterium]|jgi:nucleoside-diphosphate-sugar epimerase|nr:SDR family oxidoreductase [Bifidobacteriaceae bacterium]